MPKINKLFPNRYFLFSEAGFTLVELIVVIAIIGILATVVIIIINPASQIRKAHDAERKSDLKAMQSALEQYYNDKGAYPIFTNYQGGGGNTCASQWGCWTTNTDLNFIFGQNNTTYFRTPPQDPTYNSSVYICSTNSTSGSGGYGYYSPDGQTYYLFTKLENLQDPDITPNGARHSATDGTGAQIINAAGASCGNWANYVLTNK